MTPPSAPPFLDLGSFVAHLEHSGHLRRVAKPVDKDWELACIARWAMDSTPEKDAYAILFEHVRNHSIPVVLNLYPTPTFTHPLLGHSLTTYWSIGVRLWTNSSSPSPSILVRCKSSSIWDLTLTYFQFRRRSGPLGEMVVPTFLLRGMQIHDATHAGLSFAGPMQHGAIHLKKYAERKQPMPVAAVIGAPPVVTIASAAKTRYGVDELDIAGDLAGSSVEVVRGKTVDLLVPANAECVIEGLVMPGSCETEGPFGEFLRYLSGAAPASVVDITAITHRSTPLHHGFVQQLPPSDGHLVMEMGFLGPLWFNLTRKLGLKGVSDLAIARGSAGLAILAVQIEKAHVLDSARIGRALAKFNLGQKFIYLVDEDIDIRDPDTLNWALSAGVDPQRDIEFIEDFPNFQYDPATISRAVKNGKQLQSPPYPSSVAIINATVKCQVPEISLPRDSLMLKALEDWGETGLPLITPRKRLVRLLKTHSDSVPNTIPHSSSKKSD